MILRLRHARWCCFGRPSGCNPGPGWRRVKSLCVDVSQCTYGIVQAFLQVCHDYHLQRYELTPQVERITQGNHTESFLLRRMKSGPGVKAAFTMGATARAVQKGELENFMLLSGWNAAKDVLYSVDVYLEDVDENVGRCPECERPLYMLSSCWSADSSLQIAWHCFPHLGDLAFAYWWPMSYEEMTKEKACDIRMHAKSYQYTTPIRDEEWWRVMQKESRSESVTTMKSLDRDFDGRCPGLPRMASPDKCLASLALVRPAASQLYVILTSGSRMYSCNYWWFASS